MHYAKLLLAAAAALPIAFSATLHTRNGMPVVETTTLSNGQVIDWVISDEVAPPTGMEDTLAKMISPLNGPKGAVPYFRPDPNFAGKIKKMPEKQEALSKRDDLPWYHQYVYTRQAVNNHGGGASFSRFDPYVATHDFSLIQSCVSNRNVYNSSNMQIQQTLEAGWQKYPDYKPPQVHFFSFFNTNGYNGIAPYIAGYNTDVAGWKQVDRDLAPGSANWDLSVDGGVQYDLDLRYHFEANATSGDKWWLAVNGRNIGYYPASLFNNGNIAPGSTTLATTADNIAFYGETCSQNPYSGTAMGSGEFASAGLQKAAYIRNITYLDTSDVEHDYSPDPNNNKITQPDAYTMDAHWGSGIQGWNSYMFLGGPGWASN